MSMLEQFDTDGALAETAAPLDPATRGAFFKKAGLAVAGATTLGSLMPGLAQAAKGVPSSDVAILNFALTLEHLEAEFYKQASANISDANAKEFAGLVAGHEAAHVKALKAVLGSKAVKKPTFDFGSAVTDLPTFLKTAFTLENTGVHAYLGQAGNLKTPALLIAAATIVTVEARHAAAIALIQDATRIKGSGGISPQGAFDTPKSKSAILKAVRATGFLKG
jgi:rubrerythrin